MTITPAQLVGNDQTNQLLFARQQQAQVHTAIPGIIQTFDPINQICTVQPAIQAVNFVNNGNISYPVLVDCPVFFPSGGGCTLTFPISYGDECLIVFSERCIDSWWSTGQEGPQLENRMHDLSDACVYVGIKSQPKANAIVGHISTTSTQLRTLDGTAVIDINPTNHEISASSTTVLNLTAPTININASSALNITSPTTTATGNVQVNETLTATTDVVGGGKSLKSHVHSGVTSGGSNTGAPV